MGQKTHPTGFRIGVNKTHSSKWFAAYGVYSDVLKEDYKIREFFEKKFESIYSKAGITKLEIRIMTYEFRNMTPHFLTSDI